MTLKDQIVAEYGPYTPPNRARALRHYYKECSHHFMFSFWTTKISDLTEFGSHMLYLSLLWYLSIAFSALLAVLGLPLIVAYATKGDFFANGALRKATLGNYGPIYVEGAEKAGFCGGPQVLCTVCPTAGKSESIFASPVFYAGDCNIRPMLPCHVPFGCSETSNAQL